MSEFCKPEQRNDAAAVSVIDRSSPHTGTGENTEANMSTTSSPPIPAKAPAGPVVMDRVMRGCSCLVWIIKELAFPDPSCQKRITIVGGIASFFAALGWYWAFGWL